MVTATDDFSERITAVEVALQEMNAELRVVNARLTALKPPSPSSGTTSAS